MSVIMFLLFIASLVLLVIGLIKPTLVIWGEKRNRGRVLLTYLSTAVIFMIVGVTTTPGKTTTHPTTTTPVKKKVTLSSSIETSSPKGQSLTNKVKASTPIPKPQKAIYKIGQTITIYDTVGNTPSVQYTVNSIKVVQQISVPGTNITHTANGKYYVVNITEKNVSKYQSGSALLFFKLVDKNGTSYAPDNTVTWDANWNASTTTEVGKGITQGYVINPGVSETANIVFDVPMSLNSGVRFQVTQGNTYSVQLN